MRKNLKWNVLIEDFNACKIKPYNILGRAFEEDLKKEKINSMTEFIGDITEFIDEYLEDSMKEYSWLKTYILQPETYGSDKLLCAIRLPGATRGHIEVDKNNIIKEIKFYEDSCFGEGKNSLSCYKKEVIKAVEKYIGQELIFEV